VGGFGQKAFSFLPPPHDSDRGRGGVVERRPVWREGAPAVPPMAAAGKRLKMKRRPRGFYSRAHLELGRRREMDRRAAAACLLAALVVARWCAGRLWRLDCEGWCGEGVVLTLYRRRRSVPGRNISPATSTPAPAVWAAAVGLDWRCDGSGEVTYRPVGGSTRVGEGLGRPWWQRRQPGGAVRRDGSSRE
jgi:hypothetical protein